MTTIIAWGDSQRSIRRHLLLSLTLVIVLVVGIGGWAAATEFAGAVIAQGQLVVDTNVKKVQHLTGGVVAELRVREGDHVKAGDILLRLDETQTRANLAIVQKGLDELMARQARDKAEQDGAGTITFPTSLVNRASDPDVAAILGGEHKLFELRRSARDGQRAQLTEQVSQLHREIEGLSAQQAGKEHEIGWIKQELEGVRDLWNQHLVQFTRVTSLERDAARLEGERGQFIAAIAQANGKIAETELKILQVDQDMRTEVSKDLSEVRAKISELTEKKIAAEDQLKRVDVRAPQDGVVYQLAVHTVGGVVTANGEPLMLIVPDERTLLVEAKIRPQDIDQVYVGQAAILRFAAFNQRTTPELSGEVSLVSPDASQDPKTGASYYTLRVRVPQSEIERLGGHRLVPGMPVEAFIQTSSRTVMSYLLKPIRDQLSKTFREK
jgi:HlyD family secretion protein